MPPILKYFEVGDLQFSQSTWWFKGIGSKDGLIETILSAISSERTFYAMLYSK
jgi:hypothetical protein